MCKQWNYPFPARIYPDDIRPVANLPAGKHSGGFHGYVRIHLYKINKPETFSHRFDALERAASKSPPRNRRQHADRCGTVARPRKFSRTLLLAVVSLIFNFQLRVSLLRR